MINPAHIGRIGNTMHKLHNSDNIFHLFSVTLLYQGYMPVRLTLLAVNYVMINIG